MNALTLCDIESTLVRQPKAVARRVIETYGEEAEYEVFLNVPDTPVRSALLQVIAKVRKEDEIRSWNRSN